MRQVSSSAPVEDMAQTAENAVHQLGGQVTDFLKTQKEAVSSTISKDIDHARAYVRKEPAKGLAMAFAAGALLSLLIRR